MIWLLGACTRTRGIRRAERVTAVVIFAFSVHSVEVFGFDARVWCGSFDADLSTRNRRHDRVGFVVAFCGNWKTSYPMLLRPFCVDLGKPFGLTSLYRAFDKSLGFRLVLLVLRGAILCPSIAFPFARRTVTCEPRGFACGRIVWTPASIHALCRMLRRIKSRSRTDDSSGNGSCWYQTAGAQCRNRIMLVRVTCTR
jgi:hypothetical protein